MKTIKMILVLFFYSSNGKRPFPNFTQKECIKIFVWDPRWVKYSQAQR